MRCKHGTDDWMVCSMCMAALPVVGSEGDENQMIKLQAGTVVLVRGMKMRLMTDAVVENMINFRAAGS